MFEEIIELSVFISPVVLGLMQVVKTTKKISKEWLPLTSVFVGIITSFLFIGLNWFAVAIGLIASLISMGLYDTVKLTSSILESTKLFSNRK